MIADVLRDHLNGVNQNTKCSMGKWLDEQGSDVQELFTQLASKSSLNTMALYRSLADTLPFKSTTFKLHMKGNCTCPKAS